MLISPDKLSFEQNLFAGSAFMQTIKKWAFNLINSVDIDGKSLFVRLVMMPLVTQLFQFSNTPLPTTNVIDTFLAGLFANWSAILCVPGHSAKSTFAQSLSQGSEITSVDPATIEFNLDWIVRADLAFQKFSNFDNTIYPERFIHLVVGVVKLLHEIMHTFTKKVLRFEWENRKAIDSLHDTEMTVTPMKMGTKSHGASTKGDMGYVFEEAILGDGLHLFMNFQKSATATQQHFKAYGIYFEHRVGGQQPERPTKQSRDSVANIAPDFKFLFLKKSFQPGDDIIYLTGIINAFQNYDTTSNGQLLFDCFKVDTQLLETVNSANSDNAVTIRSSVMMRRDAVLEPFPPYERDNISMDEGDDEEVERGTGRGYTVDYAEPGL